jgi:hypothetical protein
MAGELAMRESMPPRVGPTGRGSPAFVTVMAGPGMIPANVPAYPVPGWPDPRFLKVSLVLVPGDGAAAECLGVSCRRAGIADRVQRS